MKTVTSIYSCLVAALLIVLSSGGIAAALDPSNTQLGTGALVSVTTGLDDTALGNKALNQNTTVSDNTATGFQALQSNADGGSNIATSSFALGNNTNGSDDTAIGTAALEYAMAAKEDARNLATAYNVDPR